MVGPSASGLSRRAALALAAGAALGYLGLARLWLAFAYPADGSWPPPEAPLVALQAAAATLFALSALVPAIAAAGNGGRGWPWPAAALAGALGPLLGGALLYLAGERFAWPEFTEGCRSHVSADGFVDGFCYLPIPLEYAHVYREAGYAAFVAAAALAALLLGAAGVAARRAAAAIAT